MNVAADPNAAVHPLGTEPGLLLPQVVVIHLLECFFECGRVIAAVENAATGTEPRELIGLDEVLPSDLSRVEPYRAGGLFDEPLSRERRLRSAEAAEGRTRDLVGGDPDNFAVVVLDAVLPSQRDASYPRRSDADGVDMGSQVRPDLATDSQDRAVAGDRRFQCSRRSSIHFTGRWSR